MAEHEGIICEQPEFDIALELRHIVHFLVSKAILHYDTDDSPVLSNNRNVSKNGDECFNTTSPSI